MKTINICGQSVGPDYYPMVIAEIGINHGGCIKTALEMAESAIKAGADVVKFQGHKPDCEMAPAARKTIPGNSDKSIYEIMENASLTIDELSILKQYVERHGRIFLCTPFSRESADELFNIGVKAFKIGSGECNNTPLVEHIAKFRLPVIMSTGMNSIQNIRTSLDILESYGCEVALMHTTNLYPTPPELVRLGAIKEMIESFPGVPIGLSDHTVSNYACFAAVALGAVIVERHFTDRSDRKGPDISCSADSRAMMDLVSGCRSIWQMRGGKKGMAEQEQITADFAFASVCAIKDIYRGDMFTSENIWVKRPGIGEIPAHEYKTTIGQVSKRNIKSGDLVKRGDIG